MERISTESQFGASARVVDNFFHPVACIGNNHRELEALYLKWSQIAWSDKTIDITATESRPRYCRTGGEKDIFSKEMPSCLFEGDHGQDAVRPEM